MFSQLFGKYLVDKGVIQQNSLDEVLKNQQSARVKLGTIAVSAGMLTEAEAEEINHVQTHEDKRFGDIAVERGYLSEKQVCEILERQGDSFMKFLQLLTDELKISVSQVDAYLASYQKEHGFTDVEMESMKREDVDAICALYAYAAKPYVTDIAALVLRNLTRFVSGNYYIDKIEKTEEYSYQCLVGQKIHGDHTIYLAFGEDGGEGALALASGFAKESYSEIGAVCYDAMAEFSNICSGLFASDMSRMGVDIDMEPPYVYENQCAKGSAYVVPIHIDGKVIKLYIAVDSEISLGTTPYVLKIAKAEGSQVTDSSKGTVMIVDDSLLIRKMLRKIVEEHGYTVVAEAVNGAEAVEEYKKYRPDVITLDITMPVMDGLEALEVIKAYDDNVKAIMITAAGQQGKVIEAIRHGAAHFMMKPFHEAEVIEGLEGVFSSIR